MGETLSLLLYESGENRTCGVLCCLYQKGKKEHKLSDKFLCRCLVMEYGTEILVSSL